jgi:hypothetical protein
MLSLKTYITLSLKELVGLLGLTLVQVVNMKWFYFASFVAASLLCFCGASILVFGVATRGIKWLWIGGKLFVPQIAVFMWAARAMFRSFRGVGLEE